MFDYFATRFHIIVLYLHFVVICAFIKFYFSYLFIQGRYRSDFILLCKEYKDHLPRERSP